MKIKKGQVWKANNSSFSLVVGHKKGDKWNCKVLTDKKGVYNGSHKMSKFTLIKKYSLIEE